MANDDFVPDADEFVLAETQDPAQAAAAENRALFAKSAKDAATNIVQPILHPVQTAENIGQIGKGVGQKLGLVSGEEAIPAANAVGDMLVNRYGSWDAIKKTMHEDPVGFMMDASTLLYGPGALAAKAPGAVGKAGEIAKTAGATFDPVAVAGRAVAPVAKGAGYVGSEMLGLSTGAGGESIRAAFNAGREGGEAGKAFREGMTGDNMTSVVSDARGALEKMREQRGQAYRDKLAEIYNTDKAMGDFRILDFSKIDKGIEKAETVKNFKGQELLPAGAAAKRQEMLDIINDWKQLPAHEFHTVEGMDALKQKLGGILNSTLANTPERKIAGEIYNSVRKTITSEAPEYARVMKGYEQASDLIREMESTLSLNPRANVGTTLGKLQSVLRHNVNTNYGRREELVELLSKAGAPHLMEKLAGQALSSPTPRGLSRVIAGGEGAAALGAFALGHPAAAATLAGTMAGSSPALIGGASYGAGAASKIPVLPGTQGAFQAGRLGTGYDEFIPARAPGGRVLPDGARQAPDGKYYVPDKGRPGKYLRVDLEDEKPKVDEPEKSSEEKLADSFKRTMENIERKLGGRIDSMGKNGHSADKIVEPLTKALERMTPAAPIDVGPLQKAMQSMVDKLDKMASRISNQESALTDAIKLLSAPKRLLRDKDGNVTGAETILPTKAEPEIPVVIKK